MDLLGALSDSLALVPASQPEIASDHNPSAGFNSGPAFVGGPQPPATDSQVL